MRTVAFLALLIPFVGCASIMGPSAETITFESDPTGQTVIVDGTTYTMPCQVTLGTDKNHTAKFPNGQTVTISRSFQGWFMGNLLLGGLIGMAIDLMTGGVNKNLSPDDLTFRDGTVWFGKGGENEIGPDGKQVAPPKKRGGSRIEVNGSKVRKPGEY